MKALGGQLLQFPVEKKSKKVRQKKTKNLDGIKYFNPQQIKLLRRTIRDAADLALQKGKRTAVKEWAAIDLISSSGLRVSEAANLRCGDLEIGFAENKLFVNNGKGNISGHILIPDGLKAHLKRFLAWKKENGEPIGEKDYLFIGQRGHWTSQAIQQIVKKYLKQLDLYAKGKSVHALRHSYAVEMYSKEKDLLAVQKQLRHQSIQSTLIYANVSDENISGQISSLWK